MGAVVITTLDAVSNSLLILVEIASSSLSSLESNSASKSKMQMNETVSNCRTIPLLMVSF